MANKKQFKRDFYAYLPKYMTTNLEKIIEDYGDEEWFPDAWAEYRALVYKLNRRRLPAPYLYFGKKIRSSINESSDDLVRPEFKEHYNKYFKPTAQEQIRKEIRNEKNKNFSKKNFRKNH